MIRTIEDAGLNLHWAEEHVIPSEIDAYARPRMTVRPGAGLFWLFIAGVMQGAFPLPMKFAGKWKWEHLWGWYSLLAFVVLPFVLAWLTVPHLDQVYAKASSQALWSIAAFGIL